MARLIQLLLSPASRLVRLAAGEKRIACTLVSADDPGVHLPVWVEPDGTTVTGIWAIIDHLENTYPDPPLLPEEAAERGEALRLLDWAMTIFHDEITRRIVFEKASQSQTGSMSRRTWRQFAPAEPRCALPCPPWDRLPNPAVFFRAGRSRSPILRLPLMSRPSTITARFRGRNFLQSPNGITA